MKIKFALQSLEPSIFLAGPTPRKDHVPTWRPQALEILEKLGFDGTVFVPESEDWKPHKNYNRQITWEWEAMNQSTVIAFWVPRDLDDMPAFTTNVEFGLGLSSSKVVLGYPEGAKKMKYLDALAQRYNVPIVSSLEELLKLSMERACKPFSVTTQQ